MIREFAVRPMPKNQNARRLFFILLGAAVATVAISYFLPSHKGIVQLASLILLVSAVLIYTRYLGSTYSYEVAHDTEGTPIFLVTQLTGKRRTALCRVNLSDIQGIEVLTGAQYRAYKPEAGIKKYNYTPTLNPDEVHLMQVRSRTEKAVVFLELSEEYRSMLLSFIEEAKALRAMDFDD